MKNKKCVISENILKLFAAPVVVLYRVSNLLTFSGVLYIFHSVLNVINFVTFMKIFKN